LRKKLGLLTNEEKQLQVSAAQSGGQSPTAQPQLGTGEMMGLSTLQFNRNRKAIAKTLDDLASGAISESVAKVFLSSIGMSEANAQVLIDDAKDGSVDTLPAESVEQAVRQVKRNCGIGSEGFKPGNSCASGGGGGGSGGDAIEATEVPEPEKGWPYRPKLAAPKTGEPWEGVLHHGTSKQISGDTLNVPASSKDNSTDAGNLGNGVYLTPHHDLANYYSNHSGNILSSKISLKKPLVIEGDKNSGAEELAKKIGVKSSPKYDGTKQISAEWSREFSEKAKEQGYDSIVWSKNNVVEEVVSLNPVKIKKVSRKITLPAEVTA